jgi:putative CocE/NonD family hydrolase
VRFFDHWLQGKANGVEEEKPVHYYVMGDPTDPKAPGNHWRSADAWPPQAETTPFYFHTDGALSTQAPSGESESKTYRYDPKDPTPSRGGQNLLIAAGPMDQRPVEKRTDQVLFTSEPLGQPLEATGPIKARLYISSDCPDTDFAVKLCDVYPDGRSMLVTDGILRARYRKSFEKDELMEPGEAYAIDVDLWSTSLIFNKGHRIRIAVASSNAPRFEPNPNTGRLPRVDAETRVATNTIHLSASRPSHVKLPIVKTPSSPRTEAQATP